MNRADPRRRRWRRTAEPTAAAPAEQDRGRRRTRRRARAEQAQGQQGEQRTTRAELLAARLGLGQAAEQDGQDQAERDQGERRRARVEQLAARLGLGQDGGAAEQDAPPPPPPPAVVVLADGRTVARSLVMTSTEYLLVWPHPAACWVCGVATAAEGADYGLYEAHNPYGRGRTCSACVAEAAMSRDRQALERCAVVLGEVPEVGAQWRRRLVGAVETRFPPAVTARVWAPYAPGTAGRWAHVDVAELRAAVAAVVDQYEAATRPRPHPQGLACGVCGVNTAVRWAAQGLGIGGHRFSTCGECGECAATAGSMADRMDRAVSGLAALRSVPRGAAAILGVDPYAYAVDAPGWPNGTAERWAYLPDSVTRAARRRWPSLAPAPA